MPDLNPPIDSLGLGAPWLGPWFDDASLQLAAPDLQTGGDLAVPLALANATTAWLAPAGGVFSLQVSSTPRPAALQHLRRPDGSPAFGDDHLVASFSLLPEVAGRLHALTRLIAPADGSAAGRPSRARVAVLALEFPDALSGWLGQLLPMVRTSLLNDDPTLTLADYATHLGLVLSADGTTLDNGPRPMADLYRPGTLPVVGGFTPLVALLQADSNRVRLHAFDDRGLAIDPGAVAAWWAELARQQPDLWAPGLRPLLPGDPDHRRTVAVAPSLAFQITGLHGLEPEAALRARLDASACGLQVPQGLGTELVGNAASGGVPIQFLPMPGAPAARDTAPLPRSALLPSGRFAVQTTLWGTAGSTPVARDFARVALVEIEHHLTGQRRTGPDGLSRSDAPEAWRLADHQQRPSTRVQVAQAAAPALLDGIDAAAGAALGVLASGNAHWVGSVLDEDFGPRPPLPQPGIGPQALQQVLPLQLQVQPQLWPLLGGDADPDARPRRGQRVLMTVSGLPAAMAGGWLQAWPVGFDLASGERIALTPGSGRIDAQGAAAVVLELPDLPGQPGGAGNGPQGLRLALTHANGSTRQYSELRAPRPAPAGGGNAGVAPAGGAALLLDCEAGLSQPQAAVPAASLLAGASLVELVPPAGTPAPVGVGPVALAGTVRRLVDPALVPAGQWAGTTAAGAAGAGSAGCRIDLTQPAFRGVPDGRVARNAAVALWQGAAVTRTQRDGLNQLSGAGQPLVAQERLDQAVSSRASAQACVFTAPALGRYHDCGPHHLGHPGGPGGIELQGSGVMLRGPAAFLVAEHTDDRVFKDAPALVAAVATAAAATPVPAAAATDTLWAAALRTVAAGVEGDRRLGLQGLQHFGELVVSSANPLLAWRFGPADAGDPPRAYQSAGAPATDIKPWYDSRYVVTGPGGLADGIPLPPNPGWTPAQLAAVERAMDRRALAAGWGLREALPSMQAAIARAEEFIVLETPALDFNAVGPEGVPLIGTLMLRLLQQPRLKLLLCLPHRLAPGWPAGVELLRNAHLRRAVGALRRGTPPPPPGHPDIDALGQIAGDRIVVVAPAAGQGRPMRFSATSLVVDDCYALTGSTHPWRRGLSFDSSLAVAVFDEQLDDGRPAEVLRFRRALVARALGLPATRVPDDPQALLAAVRAYQAQDSARLASAPLQQPVLPPDPASGFTMDDGWNPDGSTLPDASVLALFHGFLAGNAKELA